MSSAPADGTGTPDVTIVGAGIVGVCCAAALARAGLSAEVIDPDPPGTGTSWGNAGGIAVSEVAPLGLPGTILKVPGWLADPLGPLTLRWSYLPRLLPWLLRFQRNCTPAAVARIADARASLLKQAWADWLPLLRDCGADHLVHRRGMLMLYANAKDMEADTAAVRLATDRGVPIETLAPEAIRQMEPALSPALCHARFSPDWGHVDDPFAITQAIAETAARAGVTFRTGTVTAIETGADGVCALSLLDGRSHPVRRLVVAAGAWSHLLSRQLGSPVPLETERGYHLMLPRSGVSLSRMFTYVSGSFVATPMRGGLRLAGTVELAGLDAPPDWRRSEILASKASALLPGLDPNDGTPWMGYRPSLPDSLPVIGPSPHHKNVYYAFGHGHLGLTLAATTGRLMADCILGAEPHPSLAALRIDRRF